MNQTIPTIVHDPDSVRAMFATVAAALASNEQVSVMLHSVPGAGSTMVARRLAALVPPPAEIDALHVAWLHYGGRLRESTPEVTAPFRAPHHTLSQAAMLGACVGHEQQRVAPGEVSLAHGGTLMLDELPEFRVGLIAALARTLRVGHVAFPRLGVALPAKPRLLIGTALPCPCGYHGDWRRYPLYRHCVCHPKSVARYAAHLALLATNINPSHSFELRLQPGPLATLVDEYPAHV